MPIKLVTAAQAAIALDVTPARIRQLAGAGRIKGAKRMGRDWIMPSRLRIKTVPQGRPRKSHREP